VERSATLAAQADAEMERLRELLAECLPWVRVGLEYQSSEPDARALITKVESHLTKGGQ
jgi:hypothetical protein